MPVIKKQEQRKVYVPWSESGDEIVDKMLEDAFQLDLKIAALDAKIGELKDERKPLAEEYDGIMSKLSKGREETIDCTVVIDSDNMKVTVVNDSTGELVEERKATDEDLVEQQEMLKGHE
jgi:hypothetical protein